MSQITVEPIDVEQTQAGMQDVAVILDYSQKIVIQTQPQYENAAEILKRVKSRYKELDEQRKEITKPMDTAKAKIMDLFRTPLEMLQRAEGIIKQGMLSYVTEQERKAREIQRKLEEEAQKKTDKERKAKEEQERQWREKQAQLEAEGKLEEARKAQEKADQRALEAEMIQVAEVPVIAVSVETPKGVSYSELWSAEVVDISLVPREYMIPNQQALDKVAQATKGAIQIPGVKITSRKVVSSRR